MALDIGSLNFSSNKLDISRVNYFINLSLCYTKFLEKAREIFFLIQQIFVHFVFSIDGRDRRG